MKKLFVFACLLSTVGINAQSLPPGGGDYEPGDPIDREFDCEYCGTGFVNMASGYNHASGTEYPLYGRDEYWYVTNLAEPSGAGTPVNYCAWVIPTAPIWQPEFDPSISYYVSGGGGATKHFRTDPEWQSAWISTHPSNLYTFKNGSPCTQATAGPIRFARKFEVCGGWNVDVKFRLLFHCDGAVSTVYLNGTPIGQASSGCDGNYTPNMPAATFFKDMVLNPGIYTLEFDLQNKEGSYLGVNIQGGIYSAGGGMKLTDPVCYGATECEEATIPECGGNMGAITHYVFNGRNSNQDCQFTYYASEQIAPSNYFAMGYNWYCENTATWTGGATTSQMNVVVPNGGSKALTLQIIYQNNRGDQCASYHSRIIGDCPFVATVPGGGGNRVTSIDDISNSSEVNIYPNPGTDEFHFTREVDLIIVSDLMGREVARAIDAKMISSQSWSKGTYLVKMHDGGETSYQRIIKE